MQCAACHGTGFFADAIISCGDVTIAPGEVVFERCDACQCNSQGDYLGFSDEDVALRNGFLGEWRTCPNGGEHYVIPAPCCPLCGSPYVLIDGELTHAASLKGH